MLLALSIGDDRPVPGSEALHPAPLRNLAHAFRRGGAPKAFPDEDDGWTSLRPARIAERARQRAERRARLQCVQ
jgi:hypothetical protein